MEPNRQSRRGILFRNFFASILAALRHCVRLGLGCMNTKSSKPLRNVWLPVLVLQKMLAAADEPRTYMCVVAVAFGKLAFRWYASPLLVVGDVARRLRRFSGLGQPAAGGRSTRTSRSSVKSTH